MALPREEWLHLAQKLAVGQQLRHFHNGEKRPNLIVKNLYDKYVAYCQACKTGGVVEKEHVRITGVQAPQASHDLALPTDIMRVLDAPDALKQGVLGFLAHKEMDPVYLPELHFSDSRKRIMLQTPQGWLGRDTTGNSPQKWLTYNGQNYLGDRDDTATVAVVVEDPFSYYKTKWATRKHFSYDVFSSLGTRLSDGLILELLGYNRVILFYDGDEAGQQGADSQAKRMRAMGVRAEAKPAPAGMDPKDMTIADIEFWVS